MYLTKSCYEKDHIQRRKTVRLGSLHEYRATEDEQIADPHEGKLGFELNFEGTVTISKYSYGILFKRAIDIAGSAGLSDGMALNIKIGIQELNVISVSDDAVTIRDSSVEIHQEAHNCFIFCMSSVGRKEDAAVIFPKYNAYWHIKETQHHEFGVALAKTLGGQVGYEHSVGNFILPESTDMGNLKMSLQREKVQYLPRSLDINNNNVYNLDETLKQLQYPALIKPAGLFESEKEFRYIFTFHSNGLVIPPIKNSIILRNTAPLLPFLC